MNKKEEPNPSELQRKVKELKELIDFYKRKKIDQKEIATFIAGNKGRGSVGQFETKISKLKSSNNDFDEVELLKLMNDLYIFEYLKVKFEEINKTGVKTDIELHILFSSCMEFILDVANIQKPQEDFINKINEIINNNDENAKRIISPQTGQVPEQIPEQVPETVLVNTVNQIYQKIAPKKFKPLNEISVLLLHDGTIPKVHDIIFQNDDSQIIVKELDINKIDKPSFEEEKKKMDIADSLVIFNTPEFKKRKILNFINDWGKLHKEYPIVFIDCGAGRNKFGSSEIHISQLENFWSLLLEQSISRTRKYNTYLRITTAFVTLLIISIATLLYFYFEVKNHYQNSLKNQVFTLNETLKEDRDTFCNSLGLDPKQVQFSFFLKDNRYLYQTISTDFIKQNQKEDKLLDVFPIEGTSVIASINKCDEPFIFFFKKDSTSYCDTFDTICQKCKVKYVRDIKDLTEEKRTAMCGMTYDGSTIFIDFFTEDKSKEELLKIIRNVNFKKKMKNIYNKYKNIRITTENFPYIALNECELINTQYLKEVEINRRYIENK